MDTPEAENWNFDNADWIQQQKNFIVPVGFTILFSIVGHKFSTSCDNRGFKREVCPTL
jgi:hypothetical protein